MTRIGHDRRRDIIAGVTVAVIAVWGAALSTFTVLRDIYKDGVAAARLTLSASQLLGIEPGGITVHLINEGFQPVTVVAADAEVYVASLDDTFPVYIEPLPTRVDGQGFATLAFDIRSVEEVAITLGQVPTSGTQMRDGRVRFWVSNPVFEVSLSLALTTSTGTSVMLRRPLYLHHTNYSGEVTGRRPLVGTSDEMNDSGRRSGTRYPP